MVKLVVSFFLLLYLLLSYFLSSNIAAIIKITINIGIDSI